MAVLKLSQIATGFAPALTDTVIGVVGGTTDQQYTVAQLQSSLLGIGSAISSGTPGSVLFVDAAGKLGQDNSHFLWDQTNQTLNFYNSTVGNKQTIAIWSGGLGVGLVGAIRSDGNIAGTQIETIDDATAALSQGGGLPPPGVKINSTSALSWSNGAHWWDTSDVILLRDGAGILAQQNGVNAQTFNLYNTFTNSTNYERAKFGWNANVLEIGTQAVGTGVVRNLSFVIGGVTQLDYGVTSTGVWTNKPNLQIGLNTSVAGIGNLSQVFIRNYIGSGTMGPSLVMNAGNISNYFGFGPATASGSDGRFWFGQNVTGFNGAWDTSTSAGHLAHFEVFNGSLGLGSAGTVDVYLTRSAAGVLTLSQTVGGSANVQLAAGSVRGAAVAFASVPTPVEGMLVAVTDSSTNVWGAAIAGGGANHVLAYYNGTNWTVAGK